MYRIRFTVEGEGNFPIDMLRYDQCHPTTQEDVGALDSWSMGKNRKVTLTRHNNKAHWGPTRDRWTSFGWKVVEVQKGEKI